jgi:hypothetical protein
MTIREKEWRWNGAKRRWELVDVGDIPVSDVAGTTVLEFATSAGDLGCAASTAVAVAVAWIGRTVWRRSRRRPSRKD